MIYPPTSFLEFVDRAKESLKEFDGSVLISLIRAETNLDESPLYGGLDLAKAVVDEVVEEFKSSSSQGEHDRVEDDLLAASPQEIRNENNGV